MNKYIIEYTDLFCGELNYSHITRFCVSANTERGAINKVSQYLNLSFRKYHCDVYHSASKLSALVIADYDHDDVVDYCNMYSTIDF